MEGNVSITWNASTDYAGWSSEREPLQARELGRPVSPPPRRRSDDDRSSADGGERLAVRVIDNPVNTYEEVIVVCARVLGISLEQGFRIAQTIDHEGSCLLGDWPHAEAERIAAGIAVIGIEVRLEPVARA